MRAVDYTTMHRRSYLLMTTFRRQLRRDKQFVKSPASAQIMPGAPVNKKGFRRGSPFAVYL